jgi:hypothetical protein
MLFKNPVRTSKRTPHFTITKINGLTLFKEIIAVYSENRTKPINTKCSITYCQSRWFIQLPLNFNVGHVIKEYLDLRGMRWRENGGRCTMRNFIIWTHPQISLGKSSQGEWGRQGMWHAWERREKMYKVLLGNPEGKRWLGRPRRRWEDGIRMDLREIVLGVWIGFDWLRIGTGCGVL